MSQKLIRVMHIIDKLSVSGSGIHGVTKAIEWWIPRFDSKQFQFIVCSLRTPEAAGEILKREGIRVTFLSKGKFDPRTLTSLLSLVKQERTDILHLHGYGATNFGRIVSSLTGLPNIVHEHAVLPHQPFYQTVADTLLSSLTTKAIAISEPVREFMLEKRKIRPEKLETFFYGLPLSEFQAPLNELQKKRTDLGISLHNPVVCTVGRLDTAKGRIYLLKAAVSILKELPQTRFLIVGDSPERAMLQSEAQQQGIAEQVIFTGFRQDIPAILALSDIVAIPSLYEGGADRTF